MLGPIVRSRSLARFISLPLLNPATMVQIWCLWWHYLLTPVDWQGLTPRYVDDGTPFNQEVPRRWDGQTMTNMEFSDVERSHHPGHQDNKSCAWSICSINRFSLRWPRPIHTATCLQEVHKCALSESYPCVAIIYFWDFKMISPGLSWANFIFFGKSLQFSRLPADAEGIWGGQSNLLANIDCCDESWCSHN